MNDRLSNTQFTTLFVLLGVGILLIVYDVAILIEDSPRDTISWMGMNLLYQYPAVSHVFGGIIGHIMWPSQCTSYRRLRIVTFAAYHVSLVVVNFTIGLPNMWAIWPFLAGIPTGLLWSQLPPKKRLSR